jgi:hypothetical protein
MLFYFIYEFNIWNALLVLSKLALTFTLFSFVSAEKSLPIDLASAKNLTSNSVCFQLIVNAI